MLFFFKPYSFAGRAPVFTPEETRLNQKFFDLLRIYARAPQAVTEKDRDKARDLLDQGAAVTATDPNGSTFLLMSLVYRLPLIPELLIERHSDTTAKNKWGNTPAKEIIRQREMCLINCGLDHDALPLDSRSDNGTSLLMAAADCLDTVTMERIIRLKPDEVNVQRKKDGATPLTFAVDSIRKDLPDGRNMHAVNLLLNNQADPGLKDKKGKNALDHARDNKDQPKIVKRLEQVTPKEASVRASRRLWSGSLFHPSF